MQRVGDLIVDTAFIQKGQVTGTTYVKSDGHLTCKGQLAGGLIIEPGGNAIIHGQVARNIINNGKLELYGQVCGRLIGNPAINPIEPEQIVGEDLEVPFQGQTYSSSLTYSITV